jgi:hypothetical protein
MIGRALHYVSLACCLFVVASFGLWALNQTSNASSHQANEIAPPTQTTTTGADAPLGLGNAPAPKAATTAKPAGESQPRRFIDSVAHKLESPFDGVVASSNGWVNHIIPLLLALAVYGLGLGFLGRFASGRALLGAGPKASPNSNPYV